MSQSNQKRWKYVLEAHEVSLEEKKLASGHELGGGGGIGRAKFALMVIEIVDCIYREWFARKKEEATRYGICQAHTPGESGVAAMLCERL